MNARVNLAPEAYQSIQRDKQRRKVATAVAVAICVASGGLIAVGLTVWGGQTALIATLTSNIQDTQKKILAVQDVKKAATTQQHLETWQQLAKSNVYFSKFYSALETVAPQTISVSQLKLASPTTIEASGLAINYNAVTKLAKALEAANIEIGKSASPSNQPYFTDVRITSVSSNGGNGGVDYKITATVASEVTSGR